MHSLPSNLNKLSNSELSTLRNRLAKAAVNPTNSDNEASKAESALNRIDSELHKRNK